MVKEVRFVSIDERGRIVIPHIIRKSLGLTKDSHLMMIADTETKEIRIKHSGFLDALKFKITMKDEAGALAKIATIFGNRGISLVYGESLTLETSKTAIWTIIGPKPKDIDLEQLKIILQTEGNALKVEIEELYD